MKSLQLLHAGFFIMKIHLLFFKTYVFGVIEICLTIGLAEDKEANN